MSVTSKHKDVYKQIDEILWNDWDPIGVNEYEEARDEYQSYLPLVFNLKKNNAGKETIAQHLLKIETESMGLFGNIENCKSVAEKIVEA
jgi:hypothetical protein